MARRKPPGRGGGGRQGVMSGKASFSASVLDEIYQDPAEDEDTEVALEETRFVVSSPAVPIRRNITQRDGNDEVAATGPEIPKSGQIPTNQSINLVQLRNQEIAKEPNPAKRDGNRTESPRKWGDRTEETDNPKSQDQKGEAAAQGKRTWANVVGNRDSAKGIQLNFVPPSSEGIVEFTDDDIEAGVSAWSNAIIGQIMGDSPRFKEVVGFVHRAWSRIEVPRVHQLQSGVFLFHFQSEESKRRIMARNWSFRQEPWLLNDWSPDFKPETRRPTTRKVWIKLPGLHLKFWTKQGIEKIASGVGIPLATDALTANKDAINFARALVEIDLLKPHPCEVKCKLPDGSEYTQKVEYEGIPEHPKWDIGKKATSNKGKEVDQATLPVHEAVEKIPSSSNQAPQGETEVTGEVHTEQLSANQKKKRKRKKKGNTPPANPNPPASHGSSSVVIGSKELFASIPSELNTLPPVLEEQEEDEQIGNQLPKPPDPGGKRSSRSSSSK